MKMRIPAAGLLCAIVTGVAAASAEAPRKPAPLWSLSLSPGEGAKWDYGHKLALGADGTALAALTVERGPERETKHRVLAIGIDRSGAVVARTTPGAEEGSAAEVELTADRDGFALAVLRDSEKLVLYRLARDGTVRAAQPLRFPRDPMNELRGMPTDGRGNLLLHGGVGPGPYAPAIAGVGPEGRVLWQFVGKHTMPPGGVVAAVFRRDGGNEAIVIDREKPFWERRSARGALLMRRPLALRHYRCRAFLDERRLVDAFYNWTEPHAERVPEKHWVLALTGPDGRILPGHAVFDVPERENAYCHLAVNAAGWIAVSLEAAKIMVFDGALARRGDIDLAALPDARVTELAVDDKGSVLALVDTGARGQGRKFTLHRFAPIAH